MSRNFQQLGAPRLKVRIEGEDGLSPDQRLLIEQQFQGEIGRFYQTCRQSVDLSKQPGYKQFKALPGGAQLRYSYNGGQETMDIRVSPKRRPQEEPPKQPTKEPWDFLLIDLNIPIFTTGYASNPTTRIARAKIAARMRSPESSTILAVDAQVLNSPYQQSPETVPTLMYGGAPVSTQIGGTDAADDDTQVSSLLVDIRAYKNEPVVMIDVYGSLEPIGLSKGIVGIITRYIALSGGSTRVPTARLSYTGGADTLTYISTTFPGLYSQITDFEAASGTRMNNLIPYNYGLGAAESVLSDPAEHTPDSTGWVDANIDVFDKNLWYENFVAQWADITPPYAWTDGSWTSGEDFPYFEGLMATIPAPADGVVNFSAPFSTLGAATITTKGDSFWFQRTSSVDYYGVGDPGTPPPNNYGTPDGAPFAIAYSFAQVWKTYIYRPSVGSPPATVSASATMDAVAFKGFEVNDTPTSLFRWSWKFGPQLKELYDALSLTVWKFGRWELADLFPSRPNLRRIAEAITITQAQDLTNPGNGVFLGRVTFVQEGAAFSFTPASAITA